MSNPVGLKKIAYRIGCWLVIICLGLMFILALDRPSRTPGKEAYEFFSNEQDFTINLCSGEEQVYKFKDGSAVRVGFVAKEYAESNKFGVYIDFMWRASERMVENYITLCRFGVNGKYIVGNEGQFRILNTEGYYEVFNTGQLDKNRCSVKTKLIKEDNAEIVSGEFLVQYINHTRGGAAYKFEPKILIELDQDEFATKLEQSERATIVILGNTAK